MIETDMTREAWLEAYRAEKKYNAERAKQIERGAVGEGVENRFTEPVWNDLSPWLQDRIRDMIRREDDRMARPVMRHRGGYWRIE